MKEILVGKIQLSFLAKFLLLRYQICLLVIDRELWWMNQEWLERRCRRTVNQKWSQCLRCLVRYHPVNSNSNIGSTAQKTDILILPLWELKIPGILEYQRKDNIKMCFREIRCEFSSLREAGSYKHGNEPSRPLQTWEFLTFCVTASVSRKTLPCYLPICLVVLEEWNQTIQQSPVFGSACNTERIHFVMWQQRSPNKVCRFTGSLHYVTSQDQWAGLYPWWRNAVHK
jgi:hypothetical protein